MQKRMAERASVAMIENQSESPVGPKILRGALDSLSLYEITDYELGMLEGGSPSATLLNFAIASVSVGLSFLGILLTVQINSVYVFAAFLVLTIIGLFAAAVLFTLWCRTRSQIDGLVAKIKARVPRDVPHSHEDASTDTA